MASTGFTLVELSVVAVVLAILAAVIVPVFSSSSNEAKDVAVRADLSRIRVIATGALQPKGAPVENRGGWLYDSVSVRFVLDHEDYDHL